MTGPARVDRRRGERRGAARPAGEESWFGPLGVDPDTVLHHDSVADGDPGVLAGQHHVADAQARLRPSEARRLASGRDHGALQRIYRTYLAARAALAAALVLAPWFILAMGGRALLAVVVVCMAYAAQAVMLWLMPRWRPFGRGLPGADPGRPRWVATIGVDIAAFAALHLLEPISNLNFAALLVLPVLMAGVLTPRPLALGVTSTVALLLLLGVWRGVAAGGDGAVLLSQAGLAAIGLFAIALLAGELATRLAREEMAARGSMEMARQQAQLNRLVIEEMVEGVLVVDRGGRVRAANPAARSLLAARDMDLAAPFQLQELPAWDALRRAVERAFADGLWPSDAQDIRLEFERGETRTLLVRARFTRRRSVQAEQNPPEDLCVLFIEDALNAQARMRQEKMAAMGRVSAGIAHEFRNPLAAISQANALMLEDELSAPQRRLADIVADNVERLKRIVDDVMELATGSTAQIRVIDACAVVGRICTEWARTAQIALGPDKRISIELPREALGVAFDPEHLRRVLVNLLDNANRHASAQDQAVLLQLAAVDERTVLLVVVSDGAPIPSDIERHLFEPFFSTRSRGTGLGLYICRELCERYGARIDYRQRPAGQRHRNEFRVAMRRAMLPAAEPVPST